MEGEHVPGLSRVCGVITSVVGLCAAAYSARHGMEAFTEQPIMEIARQVNDAEKVVSGLSFAASVCVTSAGVFLATKPEA